MAVTFNIERADFPPNLEDKKMMKRLRAFFSFSLLGLTYSGQVPVWTA